MLQLHPHVLSHYLQSLLSFAIRIRCIAQTVVACYSVFLVLSLLSQRCGLLEPAGVVLHIDASGGILRIVSNLEKTWLSLRALIAGYC